MVVTLDALMGNVNKGIECTTKGDFQQALDKFRTALQTIPLMALTNQDEIKEVHLLIRKVSEYITAMRIEI